MIAIPMRVSVSSVNLPVSIGASKVGLPVGIGVGYQMIEGTVYEGPYEFTPTGETQIAHTADRVTIEDIVINPIPNNYGLITYNGRTITVS